MSLTKKALKAIRNDSDLRAKLMLGSGKSEYTIKRWMKDNSDNLTMSKYTKIISQHTGLKESDILEIKEELDQ
jgi:ribosomal protein L33